MNAEVLNTRVSKWGEGPVWWKDHLYYVDIEGFRLLRFDPETGKETSWEMDQRIGFALPCLSGKWIWGGDNGIFYLDLETGLSTPIVDPEPNLPDNRFNDAAISPDGRLFAGTIALKKVKGSAKLYRIDSDLSCHTAFPNVTNSNGIDWTSDGKTCYYIDTPSYSIRKFNYDTASGSLQDPHILLDTKDKSQGVPDGMCIDAEGNMWVAFCHGGCVVKFDPATSEELDRITFPTVETTSCCFGGPEQKDLYVTTGVNSQKEEKHGGKVFVVRNAGRGKPQIAFNDL